MEVPVVDLMSRLLIAQIVNALGITKIFEDDKDNLEVEGKDLPMTPIKKSVIQKDMISKDMSTNESTLA